LPELRFADPDERYAAVRLCSDLPAHEYERDGDEWRLDLDAPVARLEYQLELVRPDGGSERVLDPGNPHRAPGAFGEKSELRAEEYAPPAWLDEEGVPGGYEEFEGGRIWAPEDAKAGERLPLLVANDGPEYDELSRLTQFAAVSIARATAPRHRVALLAPGERNDEYSASARYTTRLVREILPAIGEAVAIDAGRIAGMGASLGGLAMLHVQRTQPDVFSGLFLQSGSFFMRRYDAHEVRFSRYRRVVRFVRTVRTTRGRPVPVVLTCGSAEENVHNNRQMAATLAEQGYPAVLHEVPDMHNYTAWRDAFDPYLPELLEAAW
jgi:enterochelin esterase-like enzyme